MVSINVDSNIVIRSYREEDAAELFTAIDKDRAHLHPWLEWVDKTTKPEHSLQFIQQSIHQIETQEALPLGIFYNNKLVGGTGMHQWNQDTRRAQIGYWLTKEYEGKGIIQKSLTSFISFLFSNLGLNKIEIHFIPSNTRSRQVAERLGFKTEGIIRHSIMRNGLPEDIVITGLLKSEWGITI